MEANSNEAMREAVEKMCDLFERGVICTSYANTTEEMEQIEELYRKAKVALAKPPRQCDVGTIGEQYNRFEEFCASHYQEYTVGHCSKCPFSEPACKFAWSQMPYEAKGSEIPCAQYVPTECTGNLEKCPIIECVKREQCIASKATANESEAK